MVNQIRTLIVEASYLTLLYGRKNLDFDWEKAVASYDRVCVFTESGASKSKFVGYIKAKGAEVSSPNVYMGEYCLQAHAKNTDRPDKIEKVAYKYSILSRDERLIDVLFPVLNIRQGDMITMHCDYPKAVMDSFIDAAPKNVYWYDIASIDNLFNERET